MREYVIWAKGIKNPFYKAPIDMGGKDDKGNELSIGNYFLEFNGKPFFAACGEAHFSRMNEHLWEDEIIKMKIGGLNIIASYVFWIHHEEIEGHFDWSGNKNLRKFIQLCKKHGMYLILRIGPFSHGECRNGGFPDWLFGRPFDLRCDDENYLAYTRRFYAQIYSQAEGLLFKDGGPIIGVQIENEHEHASCPWEMTTENSKEWLVSGRDGIHHMATLKRIAKEVGFDVPLYTATAWGGACAPESVVFPLWGGYAFRPWMFYDGKLKEHPATSEYIYGDFHNNNAPKYYNFDPEYNAEDFPYACCEMGGGMNVYYPYRFQLPYESVGALAQVKVGSGCNFLGYYMYHGGTHPKGKKVEFLNECAVPKFSYDYQAALGEFGQVRPSYHQLKLQHYMCKEFEDFFCRTKTVLSEEAKIQKPEDVNTLRYLVRLDEEGRGFLFINNYQDHVDCIDQKDFSITVETDLGDVRVPRSGSISLAKGNYAILPVNLKFGEFTLRYSTAQLVSRVSENNTEYILFTAVGGMATEFCFDEIPAIDESEGFEVGDNVLSMTSSDGCFEFCACNGKKYVFTVLCVEDSFRLYQVEVAGHRNWILADNPVLVKNGDIEIEYHAGSCEQIEIFPKRDNIEIAGKRYDRIADHLIFSRFEEFHFDGKRSVEWIDAKSKNSDGDGILKRPVVGSPVSSTRIVNARAILKFNPEDFEGLKQLILKVSYVGDVGYAFINGEMFHDNFSNGAPWEIDLVPYKKQLLEHGMYIYISPKKKGAYVDNSSAMAARFEVAAEQEAHIDDIEVEPIMTVSVK